MEEKYLSPIQLWQDYTPTPSGFETNILSQTSSNGITVRDTFISGIKDDIGFARVFVRTAYPSNSDKLPAVLYIGEPNAKISIDIIKAIANKGYVVATFDYYGKGSFDSYSTVYGDKYSFANYIEARDKLSVCSPTAKETCWFVWAKIARKVISYLACDSRVNGKIAIVGSKEGSLIATHVAAMDSKVSALVRILGYQHAHTRQTDMSKSTQTTLTTDNERWLAGLSAEAYAQYMTVPSLSLLSSNYQGASLKRNIEFVKSVNSEVKTEFNISPRTDGNIFMSSFKTMVSFLEANLQQNNGFPVTPNIELKIEGGNLNFKVTTEQPAISATLYIAQYEQRPAFRNWLSYNMQFDKEEKCFKLSLPESEYTDVLHAFANVQFSSVTLSSFVLEEKLTHKEFVSLASNRIIYESRFGTDTFSAQYNELFIPDDIYNLKKGACGINGLTCKMGELICYKLDELKFRPAEQNILQVNVYSEKEATLTIIFTKECNNVMTKFSASINVMPSAKWESIKFERASFKTDDFIVMKDWLNIVKMEIIGADDMLLNNMLWV